MIKGWCPDCDTLQPISPGAQQSPAFSSRWWYVDAHKHRDRAEMCEGSGKKI